MHKIILFCLFFIFTVLSFGQNKIALLTISNDYNGQKYDLNSEPSRQAVALCNAFDALGFKILPSIQNFKNKDELYRELEFRSKEISEVDLLFVHYGGHGMNSESGELIIPEDYNYNIDRRDGEIGCLNCISVNSLVNKISGYMVDKAKILHFTYDASRNFNNNENYERSASTPPPPTETKFKFYWENRYSNYSIFRFGVPNGFYAKNEDNYTTHWIKHLEKLNPKGITSISIREFHHVRGSSTYDSEYYGPNGKKLPESRIYSLEEVTLDKPISEQLKLVEH